jgi:hypothetical protein
MIFGHRMFNETVSDSYWILIGLLLCCCFPAVFSIKTASQQQPCSNPSAIW